MRTSVLFLRFEGLGEKKNSEKSGKFLGAQCSMMENRNSLKLCIPVEIPFKNNIVKFQVKRSTL
jgi:hypothetical protein